MIKKNQAMRFGRHTTMCKTMCNISSWIAMYPKSSGQLCSGDNPFQNVSIDKNVCLGNQSI